MTETTVLIVEDETELADLYSSWLDDRYTVITAYSGSQALALLDDAIDVVLLDRRLPDTSGEDILRKIQSQGLDCLVAMVSAVQPSNQIANLPIDEYITKPVERERLLESVEELVLRAGVDVTKRQLLAAISRRIVLEGDRRDIDPDSNEEYQALLRKISELESRLDVSPQEISSQYRPEACPSCHLRWDVAVDEVVGFVPLASHVWKCEKCGEVVHHRHSEDRRVARR